MKNALAATAMIATLVTGSAAFAEGGYVDHNGFINAEAPQPALTEIKPINDNATRDELQVTDRGRSLDIGVTTFVTASAEIAEAGLGR